MADMMAIIVNKYHEFVWSVAAIQSRCCYMAKFSHPGMTLAEFYAIIMVDSSIFLIIILYEKWECRLGTGVNRKGRKICAHGLIPVATKSHAFGKASILKAIMKDLPGILCLSCPFAWASRSAIDFPLTAIRAAAFLVSL